MSRDIHIRLDEESPLFGTARLTIGDNPFGVRLTRAELHALRAAAARAIAELDVIYGDGDGDGGAGVGAEGEGHGRDGD